MGINTDIWGTPETWELYTYSSGYTPAEIKTPEATRYDYKKLYDLGILELNTIDISPFFWGISKNSMFCQPQYISAHYDGDLTDPVLTVTPVTQQEPRDKALMFMLGSPGNTTISPRYDRRYLPDRSTAPSSNNYTQRTVTSFNYQKIIASPWIYAENDNHSGTWYPLKSYIDNYETRKNDYHYIKSMGFSFYAGAAGERSGQDVYRGGLLPAVVQSFDGFTGTFEDRIFWARASGFSFVQMSSSNSTLTAQANILFGTLNDGFGNQYSTPNASVATAETGFRYKYCLVTSTSDTSAPPVYYFNPDDDLWEYACLRQNSWRVDVFINAATHTADEIRDYFMTQIAYIGLPFLYDRENYNAGIGDIGIFLPIFDEYGVTTGEYAEGDAALKQRNSEWIDGRDSGFDPNRPPTPGEEDRGDLANSYANRYTNAGGLSQYVVSEEEVIKLAAFLNGRYLPTAADLDADFKGTNPQQYVVSVQKYPFSLPNSGGTADIYVGQQNTGIEGKPLFATFGQIGVLPINNASTFDFGTIDLSDPEYMSGNFLDYQKKLLLYMPFVGTEELDPRLYFGHVLGLVYRIDYNTGAVAAEIKRDGLTIETKTGTISITVPFMAADMGSFQNQIAQLSYAKDLAKIKGAGTALSAGFTMAAGAQGTMSSGQPPLAALSNLTQAGVQLAANATQLSQLDYQLEHTAPTVGTISTAAAANAFFMDARARLVVVFPSMLAGYNAQEYSHIIGNACCKTGNLGSFSGFTVCSTADLSGVATKGSAARIPTEAEKELIRKALLTGIYL